jgi:hypothetical protein
MYLLMPAELFDVFLLVNVSRRGKNDYRERKGGAENEIGRYAVAHRNGLLGIPLFWAG